MESKTGLLGRKIGMTQVFDEEAGTVIPVTVLEVGPCTILQLRHQERDGYEAVQMGFGDKLSRKDQQRPENARRRSRANRSERGHVADINSKRSRRRKAAGAELPPKANCEPQQFIREFRVPTAGYEIGQRLTLKEFEEVKAVDVVGTSKGRGFAGVMKRHNFSGQRATHGVKKCHRHMGGTGQCQDPSRVLKGKKMAGQYGSARITTRNIQVVRVDQENNLLLIKGAVPGHRNAFVMVRPTNKVG